MQILAIDASSKASGVAVFDNQDLIHYDCYTAYSKDLIKRIKKMVLCIDELLMKYPNIEKVILEEVHPENNNTINMQTQRALMWLQGEIVIMLHDKYPKIKVEYVFPSQWRSLCGIHTGRGIKRASLKEKSIEFVNKKYNLNLTNDDISDAICLGTSSILKNGISWE